MVLIREYQQKDRDSVINVCWQTGYMGEPAAGYFDDKYLFGLLFCVYYLDYEPENCFVAVDEDFNKVIGYILSSFDSRKQEKQYREKILSKIIRRAFLYTIWRYPSTFRAIWYMKKTSGREPRNFDENKLYSDYPAHLHIDIISEYHRQGVGTMLMEKLENYLQKNHIKGVHLSTSDNNINAVPFYYKMGYSLIYESLPGFCMWKNNPEVKSLIFAKSL